MNRTIAAALVIVSLAAACRHDPELVEDEDSGTPPVVTTPYALSIPANFPPMEIPADNPMTVEGVRLGRFLFYEERLSGNNTQSCGSCHAPAFCFSDNGNQFSLGIDGAHGTRNSMALVNLGWGVRFFWDGRAMTLEEQILQPVENPIEMHDTWPNVVTKLEADPAYVQLFHDAFGGGIDRLKAAKAIAQFLRTLISGNSRFDQFQRGEIQLNTEEQLGILLTQQEGGDPGLGLGGQWGADCFHCHPHGGALFTDGVMRNNGLDSVFTADPGLAGVTGLEHDSGLFKTPSLRNVALSAPYMHDGRFNTLEEVIAHYNSGGHASPTISPFMKYTQGGLQLTAEKKAQLIAFLNTLTDMDYVNNPEFQDPGPPQ